MEFECLAKSLPWSGDSDPHLASFLERRIFDSTHETGRRSVCSAATWLSFPAGFPERLGNNLVTFLPIVSEAVPLEWKIKLTFLQENKIGSAAPSPRVRACWSASHARHILQYACSASVCVGRRAQQARSPSFLSEEFAKKRTCGLISESRLIKTAQEWQEFVSEQKGCRKIRREWFLMHTCSVCLGHRAAGAGGTFRLVELNRNLHSL